MVFPKLIYPLTVIPVIIPPDFIKQLKRTLFTFIWGSSWEKANRQTTCLPLNRGGLNMVDVEVQILSIQLGWVNKLFDTSAPWQDIENFVLHENNDYYHYMFRGNLTARHTAITLVPLKTIQHSLLAWYTYKTYFQTDNPLEYPLWFNRKVLLNKIIIYNDVFVSAGLHTLY